MSEMRIPEWLRPTLERVVKADASMGATAVEICEGWKAMDELRALLRATAAPTVKAEQVPTPEFVWVRLLEALHGDNGGAFTASTDDYREAKPALVQLIAAGFFRDDADSLDGDIWTIAAGEQSEAAARFASCADAYAVLSDVLNRVFERPDEAPSLPAAGSAVEAVEVVAWLTTGVNPPRTRRSFNVSRADAQAQHRNWLPHYEQLRTDELMTVAQHKRIVAALSAQQSAQPEFCCELSYKAAKQKAWDARLIERCKCDHSEYCERCWPADFRPGGKWHGGFVAQQSAHVCMPRELLDAVKELFDAKQAKEDFERENPGNSTKRWDACLYRIEAAEDALRALLNGGEA